jgi:hypothetical protein
LVGEQRAIDFDVSAGPISKARPPRTATIFKAGPQAGEVANARTCLRGQKSGPILLCRAIAWLALAMRDGPLTRAWIGSRDLSTHGNHPVPLCDRIDCTRTGYDFARRCS